VALKGSQSPTLLAVFRNAAPGAAGQRAAVIFRSIINRINQTIIRSTFNQIGSANRSESPPQDRLLNHGHRQKRGIKARPITEGLLGAELTNDVLWLSGISRSHSPSFDVN